LARGWRACFWMMTPSSVMVRLRFTLFDDWSVAVSAHDVGAGPIGM
jgi:hypothetical protein